MIVEQIYTGCLAEAAYYIESEGEAAIIDPLRETAPYIERAEKNGARIKYIFLTHFHADFVSGQVDLAKKTGATIVLGPSAKAAYEFHEAKDGEQFPLGAVSFHWLHTPGHTLESSTILLKDEMSRDHCIFTGDTMFIGDVGRPDLAVKQGELTEKDLAGLLYDSLRNKIMPLENEVIVYPGHGAGSACGKNMSKETFDTLGNQKKNNYALDENLDKETFIETLLDGLSAPPQYFPFNVQMNKQVNPSIDSIISSGTRAIDVDEFEALINSGTLVLDVRHQRDFVQSHIPGSIFIGLDGGFAPWVGALIEDIKQPIILVVPEGREEEAVTRLSRIGYDQSQGYLRGGIASWISAGNDTASIDTISVEGFEEKVNEMGDDIKVLDVRKDGEYSSEHLSFAGHEPLDTIYKNFENVNPDQHYYIHCAGGYRSVIFESILKSKGIHNFTDVLGGFGAIKKSGKLETTEFVCPSEA